MLLGDLGADVVKVERPGSGDDTRAWGPPYLDGESAYYLAINRNKRSIASRPLEPRAGDEAARRLAERADVVVENFKSGTMERLGLSYEEVSAANPGCRLLHDLRIRDQRRAGPRCSATTSSSRPSAVSCTSPVQRGVSPPRWASP